MAQRALDCSTKMGLERKTRWNESQSESTIKHEEISMCAAVKGLSCITKWQKALLPSSALQNMQIGIQK